MQRWLNGLLLTAIAGLTLHLAWLDYRIFAAHRALEQATEEHRLALLHLEIEKLDRPGLSFRITPDGLELETTRSFQSGDFRADEAVHVVSVIARGVRLSSSDGYYVGWFPNLRRLDLSGSILNGGEQSEPNFLQAFRFAQIQHERRLEELILARSTATDQDFREFLGLNKLRRVDLSYTAVTDAALPNLFDYSPEVEWVNLRGTAVTAAGIAQLRTHFHGVIEWDDPALPAKSPDQR